MQSPEPVAPEKTSLPQSSSAAANLLHSFVSPRALTLCVLAGVVLSALVAWLGVGVHLAHLRQLRFLISGAGTDTHQLSQIEVALRIARGVQAGVFALTALAFLAWLYRLRANVRALGVRKLEFARHWSVLGFLVPGLNVVRPYQVMAEVWRASDPSVLDPFEWKALDPPRILTLWWASVVIAAALELTAFGLGHTAGVHAFKSLVASAVAVAADLATGVSTSLAYFVVTRLAASQIAKHERLLGDGEDP